MYKEQVLKSIQLPKECSLDREVNDVSKDRIMYKQEEVPGRVDIQLVPFSMYVFVCKMLSLVHFLLIIAVLSVPRVSPPPASQVS